MSRARSRRAPARRRPAPAQAGASLLVHDLKGLAGRLSLLLQNLEEHYANPLFKRTALDVLDGTVGHLKRLARELREHEGRLVVKLRLDLNRVLREALGDVRPGLAVDVELYEDLVDVPTIWGDAFLLRCAFCCTIENALEAMDGEGVILVATQLSQRQGRRRITVEIADDGPGMSPEFVREALFRPFTTTKSDGMGLGAYTFRQVAALHGGSVRILSREGEGTRVRFHFPCDD